MSGKEDIVPSEVKDDVESQDKVLKKHYEKKGDNLIVTSHARPVVLKPRDIVYNHITLGKQILETQANITKLEETIEGAKLSLKDLTASKDKLDPHLNEAWDTCVKECTKAIEEIKQEAMDKAFEDYVRDEAVTDDQSQAEVFNRWRHGIHTNPSIGHQFPDKIIRHLLYGENTLIKRDEIKIPPKP